MVVSNLQMVAFKVRTVLTVLLAVLFTRQIYMLKNMMHPDRDVDVLLAGTTTADNGTKHESTVSSSHSNNTLCVTKHNTEDGGFFQNWNDMIRSAEASNYTCDGVATKPASIHATITAGIISIKKSQYRNNQIDNEEHSYNSWRFIPIDFTFQAHNTESNPQKNGGDVFILDYQSYHQSSLNIVSKDGSRMEHYTIYRSATFTRDNVNGTYTATLFMPRTSYELHVNVSLRHYYTCHEGLLLPDQLMRLDRRHSQRLTFGPLPWAKAGELVQLFMAKQLSSNQTMSSNASNFLEDNLPNCFDMNNTEEMMLNGLWLDQQFQPPTSMSLSNDAHWTPYHCSFGDDIMSLLKSGLKHFRIGDSTMPQRTVEVGFPYAPFLKRFDYRNHHERFVNFLQSINCIFVSSFAIHVSSAKVSA